MTSVELLADSWQDAPAEHEIANYDEPKIRYRRYAEEFINQFQKKNLRKKPFFTIATNILCADKDSSDPNLLAVEHDIYLPLEISITKWSLSSGKVPSDARPMMTKVWLINPGPPTRGCANIARDHRAKHKIDFDYDDHENNVYIESDLTKVMKEINSFLTPDRIVFSIELKHIRQDLGSIKWLNLMTGNKSKPIRFLSLEDLYVVLARTFVLDAELASHIGQGMARSRMSNPTDRYNPEIQCIFHQAKAKTTDGETHNCARAVTTIYSEFLIDDIYKLTLV